MKQLPLLKSGAGFARGSSRQDYRTPPDFMCAVVKMFGMIAFDLAADSKNTQAPLFFSEARSAFDRDWHKINIDGNNTLWLNPPFNDIAPWAARCASEAKKGAHILFLTPASVGSNWFRDHVYRHARVLALNGRLHFDPVRPTWGYPKDCILSVYGFAGKPGFEVWDWKS